MRTPSGSSFDEPFIAKMRHQRALSGVSPKEMKVIESVIPLKSRQSWKKFAVGKFENKEEFQEGFVRHVETTLARSLYNCDELAAYQAASQTIRDRLIVSWNRTQQNHSLVQPKRIYYFSLEFLVGRAMDNAILNTQTKELTKEGVDDFGFRLEDLLEQEPDAALGNGGLGRLAACFVDSLATGQYPGWGYGLRYQYGIFKQKIIDGHQVEQPDYWLTYSNPWELPRYEISIDVMFYGSVDTVKDEQGNERQVWQNGEIVRAMAYDMPIPGYNTESTSNLRMWSAQPNNEFDFNKFNEGDYASAVRDQQRAETITAVLYPNDNFYSGKELRLKQQYFWVAASLSDIVRRFKKTRKPWSEFVDQVAIQLNDTHPTLAIVELQRLLVDRELLPWEDAWDIVVGTFGYTNHTVLPEALEKWPIDVIGNLLPRHLEIIYDINYRFLQMVGKRFPDDWDLLRRVSIIEESQPKQVRMAYLAIIGSHKVNGVAELHSELIRTTIFKDFVRIYGPDKFINVTNGITPRRWLLQANPKLAALIAEKTGGYDYLTNLGQLKKIEKFIHDPEFQKRWYDVKRDNKERLARLIKSQSGVEVNTEALFDIQVKRIHEYKRQQLNIFGVIYRYLQLKAMSREERQKVVPRVSIFGGKSAPGYYMAKSIICLINMVGRVVNEDPDVKGLLQVIFIEDYNVSKAEIIIPASDISEHISTAGTEASGTSNMKFVLNGGLVIGTVDGANIEITREIGEENMFLFGNLAESVEEIRHHHLYSGKHSVNKKLLQVFKAIEDGTFGNHDMFRALISSIRDSGDYYLVGDDFDTYLEAQNRVDQAFRDRDSWNSKSISAVANMGFFSSDRAVDEYAETIWNVESVSPNASQS